MPVMQRLLITLLVIMAIGAGAVLADLPADHEAPHDHQLQARKHVEWVRTVNGWERASTWRDLAEQREITPALRIHPLLIALLEVLTSLAALMAFSPETRSLTSDA